MSKVSAQKLEDYYRAMPDSICPLLTQNNRLDLCDYLAANMKAEVRNRLGGTTEMTKLTPTYAHVRLTASTEVEYELIATSIDTLIRVTNTAIVSNIIRHSKVTLYNIRWQKRNNE